MRVEDTNSKTAASQLVVTNLVSFTLIVSAVVFLGAVCRFLKRCCAKLSKKKDKDVIAFREVRRISVLRKSTSVPRISTEGYLVVHQEQVPFDTEEMPVQPEVSALRKEIFLRPRAPTDPGSSPKVRFICPMRYFFCKSHNPGQNH